MNMLRLWLIAPFRTVFHPCGAQRDERATCRPTAAGRAPMHVFEVRNAELLESITQQAAEHGITYAAIVALIGAVDSFTVSTNPAGAPPAHLLQLSAARRDDRHRRDRRRQAPHP